MEIKENFSLLKWNSWRIGGEAQFFCSPINIEECIEAHEWALKNSVDITYLGWGSNVLISDEGIEGLVICTRKLKSIEIQESDDGYLRIICLAGNMKMELLKSFLKYQLPPALMFAGIPGDIGGGIAMNAGISENVFPKEFTDVTEWVEVLRDREIVRYQHEDLQWSYRHCDGWQPGMIVRACIRWPLADKKEDIRKLVQDAKQLRLKKQPLELPSCGSVFANPKPFFSGQLIEELGLKGTKIGGAQISEKHANFIVNLGGATAKDVDQLIQLVIKTVKIERDIDLKTEVRYLGLW